MGGKRLADKILFRPVNGGQLLVTLGSASDLKEQVRQAVDIVDLVGSYVQLRRQGRNFVALCPWHDDSRPSLTINAERQSFKCWVCDIGGDVFSFLMKAEGLEFREALEMLAERAGIPLQQPTRPGGHDDGSTDQADDKRTLYRLLAWADEQFHHCLISAPEAEPARSYLAGRDITTESIKKFHLGFAPQRWDWMVERARGTEWTPRLLERVGLLRRKELDGGYYDWFRGRVMFTIRDGRSRPIAFGGRVLPQLAGDRDAKYINSPETPLFSKSRELYGLDLARESFRDAGGAIIMEGYTDCIMAHQHGITNAVAVLGTALGERHLQLLRRYTDSITLVLDGDNAGRRRTNEILDTLLSLFEKNEINIRILTLPEGIDPCDFIATHGSDAFRKLVNHAADALEHKFQAVTNGLDTLTNTHRAAQAAEQLLATIARIRPAAGAASSRAILREQQMVSRIAHRFHLPEEQLRTRLASIRRDARGRAPARQNPENEGNSPSTPRLELAAWERDLLELLIIDASFLSRIEIEIEPEDFQSGVARRIYEACREQINQDGTLDFGRLMSRFDDPAVKKLLVDLGESGDEKTSERERWYQMAVAAVHQQRKELKTRQAFVQARENPHDAERMLEQFYQQSRTKNLSEYERRKK
jgi:DNA primase